MVCEIVITSSWLISRCLDQRLIIIIRGNLEAREGGQTSPVDSILGCPALSADHMDSVHWFTLEDDSHGATARVPSGRRGGLVTEDIGLHGGLVKVKVQCTKSNVRHPSPREEIDTAIGTDEVAHQRHIPFSHICDHLVEHQGGVNWMFLVLCGHHCCEGNGSTGVLVEQLESGEGREERSIRVVIPLVRGVGLHVDVTPSFALQSGENRC
eukprot:GHVN01021036.1.p2 GENE.GHVN01021036.1~~GHVN01021036.1.p2  ORF type:complete len:211 (+),score=0.94 GHVN01021036.1:36-668(+)